ncbi:MAG: transcriptional repressor LexA [Clostridia bacterium]|nr:transcriptional repressor LexA [Clostridia bacterium]
MKKAGLEPKEQQIFDYICENIRKNGYSPSIRDICLALDIRSTSTVHTCLDRLEKKGYIQKENGKSRTIRIDSPDFRDKEQSEEILSVPLIGRVAAGVPILAVENCEGYVHYPKGLRPMPQGELFALRVKGESMIEAGILNGDVVIVERASTAENGEIIVAMIDNEATVKVFYRENGHYRLQPRNRTMLPMIVSRLTVLGKVVASLRYYN